MVKRVLELFRRETSGLHEAAILLAVSSVLSQFLALVRDRLFASTFGAGLELDIYYSAFRLPDIIYVTIASFISITIIIPLITRRIGEGQEEDARCFVAAAFNLFIMVMVTVSVIAFIFMPYLARLVAPGFPPEAVAKLALLSRILLFSPILLGLSNLFGSVTQAYKRFLLYSLSPLVYNLGIIFGVIALYPKFGLPGLAWGVVIGAFFHFAVQWPAIIRFGYWPRLNLSLIGEFYANLKKLAIVSLPRTLTLAAHQLSIFVLVAIASYLNRGVIAVFNLSFNLQSVPLAIVGVSYSVAAFPTLSKLFSAGRIDKFLEKISEAGRYIIFWSLPATVMFIVLRAQIVRVILGAGEFDWTATRLTAACLAVFAVSVAAQGLVLLFVRGYYAGGQTTKPLIANVGSSLFIIAAAFGLVKAYQLSGRFQEFANILLRLEGLTGTDVVMLPTAFTLGMILNAAILYIMFKRDFGQGAKSLRRVFFQCAGSALLGGLAAWGGLKFLDNFLDINMFWGIFGQGLGAGLLGLAVIILTLKASGSRELENLVQSLKRKFWKAEAIRPEMEELV